LRSSYANDQTNWWIPNRPPAEAMLRSTGLETWRIRNRDMIASRAAYARRQYVLTWSWRERCKLRKEVHGLKAVMLWNEPNNLCLGFSSSIPDWGKTRGFRQM